MKLKYIKYYDALGQILRAYREAQTDMKQEQLAEKLGVKQSYISKIEKGNVRLGFIETREYCEALGYPFDELLNAVEARVPKQTPLK